MPVKRSALVFAALLLAGLAQAEPPDSELINEVEAAVKLPSGARHLHAYARYYAIEAGDGRRILRGVFLIEDKPGLHDVDDHGLPIVRARGCDVVKVRYSIDEKKVLHVACGS